MFDPCNDPTYDAYRNAVRVVFHTTFLTEEEENAAVATMQATGAAWREATGL